MASARPSLGARALDALHLLESVSKRFARPIKKTKYSFVALLVLLSGFSVSPALALAGYPNPNDHGSTTTQAITGAYIIDAGALSAGATKQTIAQGIKPYGLIYALVKAKVPVEWVINRDKAAISQTLGNAAPDFTFDCDGSGATYASKNYKSGAFIIPKEFAAQAKNIVATWRTSGVTVDGPCTVDPSSSVPVFATISGWPRAALDAQNGKVAVDYFTNAGIAQGSTTDATNPPAYRYAAPSQLTPCDDIYIMPHADPTYATHSALIPFIKAGGSFYASCHAVSEIENMEDPSAAGTKVMNLLATNGLVHYNSHVQGSVPYAYFKNSTDTRAQLASDGTPLDSVRSGDPVAQFLGITDASTQNGSEQIYIPKATSAWRPTTQLIAYNTTQSNAYASGNGGPASSLLYGPAYGNTDYGWVMYQGGHSVNKGTVDDVTSQRAFFNFLLLTAVDRRLNGTSLGSRSPIVNITEPAPATTIAGGSQVTVSGTASGGSGSYTYKWDSQCYDQAGTAVAGGTFLDGTKAKTTFTAPDVAGNVNCNMSLTVIDTCGRFSFGTSSVVFAPEADLSITKTGSPTTASINSEITYTLSVTNNGKTAGVTSGDGNVATDVVLTDPLPAQTTFVSVSAPSFTGTAPSGASCSQLNGTITCALKNMADEQTVTVTIVARVNESARGQVFDNTAKVSASSADEVAGNDSATSTTTIRNSGIAIVVSTNKSVTAASGGSIIYTYTVTNPGTSPLSSVVVNDQNGSNGGLGDNLNDITPTRQSGDTNGDSKLDPGETWIYTDTRTISSSTSDQDIDSNVKTKRTVATATGSDGSATVSSSNSASVQVVNASIALSKTPSTQLVTAGSDAYFTIKATNTSDGPATFTNVTVSDVFTTGGTLSCQAGTSPFTIASLAQGESWQTTCKIIGVTGSGTNTLAASANDPFTTSPVTIPSAQVTITAGTPPLLLSKSVTPSGAVKPGSTLTYKLTLINTGSVTQTGVYLSDTLAPGLTAGTATISRMDTSASSGKTYGVIAWDKFAYTAGNSTPTTWSGAQGFSSSTSSWSVAGTNTGTNKGVSISQSNNGSSGLAKSENQSLKIVTQNTKTSVISRSIDLGNSFESISVFFECAATSSGASVAVSLGSFSAPTQDCAASTTRKSKRFDVPAGTFANGTNAPQALTFTVTGTSSTSSTVYIDDVFVVSGAVQNDSFTGSTSGSTYISNAYGFSDTGWTETDTSGKLSLSTTSSSSSTSIYWNGGSSTATASAERTYSLSGSSYYAASLNFTCIANTTSFSGSKYFKIDLVSGGTTTNLLNANSSAANPCADGSNTMANSTALIKKNVSLGSLGAGTKSIKITVYGQYKIYFDDFVITAQGKGDSSSMVSTTGTLTSALAGPYSLAPNEKIEITFPVTIASPYPVAGATVITNGATARSNEQTTPSSASVSSPLAITNYSVTKSVSATPMSVSGSTYTVRSGTAVTYTYVAKNSGSVLLNNLVISDPACVGTITLQTTSATSDSELDPGESWTYVCTSKTLNATDSGTVVLDAMTPDPEDTNVPPANIDVDSVSDSLTVNIVNPSLHVEVSPASTTIYSGKTVKYTYTVTATGSAVANPTVEAQNCSNIRYVSGDDNSDQVLQPSETWIFSCLTGAIVTNQSGQTVTVTGTDTYVAQSVTSNSQVVSISVVLPAALAISSTVESSNPYVAPAANISVGSVNSIVYRYVVTNSGQSAVSGVVVKSDHCSTPTLSSGDTNNDGKLQPSETWLYSCSVNTPIANTTIANATASGTDDLGSTVLSDATTNRVDVMAPGMLLTMEADKEYARVGASVSYTYKIENYGETTFSSFTPADDHCAPLVRILPDVSGDEDNSLEPGEIWSYSCTRTLSSDILSTFTVTDVVDATIGGIYHPTATNAKVFAIDPTLTISQLSTSYEGTTSTLRDGPAIAVDAYIGDTVVFEYSVQASKGVNASSIDGLNSMLISEIADTSCTPITPVLDTSGFNIGDTVNPGQLDPTETWKFTCSNTAITDTVGVKYAQATVTVDSPLDAPTVATSDKIVYIQASSLRNSITVYNPPTVVTNNASSTGRYSAVLNGVAEWGGLDSTVKFCYGTSPTLLNCTLVNASPSTITTTGNHNANYSLSGLTPGQTYYFQIVGTNSRGTSAGEIKSFTTLIFAPTATTNDATAVSPSAGTLNGDLEWGGADTAAKFCYGTDANLVGCTEIDATPSTITGEGTQSVSRSLTGLIPNTTYYFRVIGINRIDTTLGQIKSFVTQIYPPTANTQPATEITRIRAVLNGHIEWGGADTTVTFCYGTNSNLTGCTTASADPGLVQTDGTIDVSLQLSGLTSGTTYYFRVIGSNSNSTVNGSILSFQTANGKVARSVIPKLTGKTETIPTVRQNTSGVIYPEFSSGDGVPTYQSNTSSVCTVNPTTGAIEFLTAGDCEIDVTSPETDEYFAATHTPLVIHVEKTPQVISAQNPGPRSWLGTNYRLPLSPSSNASLPVTLTSLTPDVCEIDGEFVVVIGPGVCRIQGSGSAGTHDGTEYSAPSDILISFTITDDVVVPPTPQPKPKPTPAPAPAPTPEPSPEPSPEPQPEVVDKSTGTRSVTDAANEVISGFAPGKGLRIWVTGARTAGQFVVTQGFADLVGLSKAIEESTARTKTDFAQITDVQPLSGVPLPATEYRKPVTKETMELFAASGLAAPLTIRDLNTNSKTKWLRVQSKVAGYVPGTAVYLVVTTQPIILGAATIDKFGNASVDGLVPVSALPNGGHNLRLVGVREIAGFYADGKGNIKLTDDAMKAIQAFDPGTKATVQMYGEGVNGQAKVAIREIYLDRDVAWWTVWLAGIISLLALALRYLRKPVSFKRRITAVVVTFASGIPALIIGWLSASYELWIGFGISTVAGLVYLLTRRGKKKHK